ncbi:MAG: bifunctional 4-hydroxy-2-oxoglutarate aldolase/2-dehydro-3-deoxy-phosphogluconate aldolase [Lachnospiraceae bacterium]|nr:bifunctional 4-hydroxy-2-oxoglutarate aldolase/2-dehydro-3-deoxy-phosphogluconate aldolase [Lachnospiraceae bacterium]
MNKILEQISKIGIVPVVKLDDAKHSIPLAKALCEGGLPCAEITFRTAAAEESIRLMSTEFPDMLIGAGTVLTTEQVDKAISAGAKFIVSPGLNPQVVEYCVSKNIPITPGCATPSDIEKALSLGLEVVKFFPAEAAGGLSMIKAMSAPYTSIKFMPTGGINAGNINSYLANPKVIACGGSWMVSDKLIKDENFDEITRLTKEAVNTMLNYEVRHVGINIDTREKATTLADEFNNMFGFETTSAPGDVGYFAGTGIELLHDHNAFTGEKGHIAIAVNSIERAMYHLGMKGIKFIESTARYNENGICTFIYIDGLYGGFTIHLSKRI